MKGSAATSSLWICRSARESASGRRSLAWLALGFSLMALPLTGCSLYRNGARTLIVEPVHFATNKQAKISKRHSYAEANHAWSRFVSQYPDQFYSCDYERGFMKGFADHLQHGGSGQPPPVPPRDYWRAEYRTPGGRRAAKDWFAGFSDGARMALESRERQFKTVPSSVAISSWDAADWDPMANSAADEVESVEAPMPELANPISWPSPHLPVDPVELDAEVDNSLPPSEADAGNPPAVVENIARAKNELEVAQPQSVPSGGSNLGAPNELEVAEEHYKRERAHDQKLFEIVPVQQDQNAAESLRKPDRLMPARDQNRFEIVPEP